MPASINRYLRDYQREGIRFLHSLYARGLGGILADDMGLGAQLPLPVPCQNSIWREAVLNLPMPGFVCKASMQDRTGQDRTGQDRTGQDRTGQDRTGQDRTGQDRTGQ